LSHNFRLPVPCSLEEGESLPGFLSRATHINSYGSMFSIASYFGLNTNGKGLDKNQMKLLAKGSLNVSNLASFTESKTEEIRQAALDIRQPIPGTISDDYVSFQRWRFCPLCVREGRPHQRAWMISFVTACPEHRCQLVDDCQACGSEYSTNHMLTRYCVCCQKPAQIVDASEAELKCAEILSNLIDDRQKLKIVLDRLMLAWFLTNPNCLRPHYRVSPQLKTVSEMRDVVCRLWPACEDECSFYQALSNYGTQLSDKWKYLPYLSTVFKKRARTAGARLPISPKRSTDLGFVLPESDWWAPINETAQSAGLTAFVLKRLIAKRYIKSKTFNEKGPDKKRHKFLMVDLDSLNEFIGKLLDTADPIEGQPRLTKIQHYPIDEIARDALAGKLSIYYGDSKSISDLWVANAETAKAKRKESSPEKTLTAKEAAKVLDTYHAVIVDLIKHGFLKEHPASGTRKLLLMSDSLEQFKAKYIVVGKIANEYDVNATNLAEKLASIGIEPEPHNTLVKIYQKNKLSGLKAKTLKSISSYQTKTGRKPSFSQKDASSKRVKNLIRLVNDHGGISNFTRKFGGSQGTLSLMLREKKSFGDLAVSRMEAKVGLPEGWFDN